MKLQKNVLKLQLQINRNMLHFIEFGSKKIEFTIKYTTRKTFGIKVSPDKTVKVSVPLETSMEEIENLAAIVSSMIEKRNSLGLSQRELAAMCGVPQSSVARIESFKTTPKLDTLLKLMHPLGLRLTVAAVTE